MRRRRCDLGAVALTIVVVLALPATGGAQETFYEAYELGLEHERSHRWQDARAAFLTAIELRPAAAERVKKYGLNFLSGYDPYLHIARAELELGLLDDAEDHLERSATAGVSPESELAALRAQLRRLRQTSLEPTAAPSPRPAPAAPSRPPPRPTLLDVSSIPEGADVLVDGRLVGVTPVRLPIEPGTHRLELRRAGFLTVSEQVRIKSGESLTRQHRLAAQPTALPQPTPVPRTTGQRVAQPIRAHASPTPSPPPHETAPTALPATAQPALDRPSSPPELPSPWLIGLGALLVVAVVAAVLGVLRRHPASYQPSATTLAAIERTVAIRRCTPLPDTVQPEFGPYRLLMILGRGGMATTYLAERVRDKQVLAIKIPHEHLLDIPEFVARFVREGALGATVHHPNIIRIHEADTINSKPFIAMELLDGMTLEQRLAQDGALPLRTALEITRSIALALDYAHMKGIVHRDLKPENVMILPGGTVKVMDYGIARVIDKPGLTATNAYLGTPLYSAPESIDPAQVDGQSDLYSLGIMLYRMLCNRLPFESSSPLKLLEMHSKEPLPPFPRDLDLPDEVRGLVERLTNKDKAERYPDAETFLREVNHVLNEL